MRTIILAVGILITSLSAQAEGFSATNPWYKRIYGTETIQFVVDYVHNVVILPPRSDRQNVFEFVFASPRAIVALTRDRMSLLEINFVEMSLSLGDSFERTHLGFGKYLKSPIVQTR